jgi:hypothetical protein
MMPANEEMRLKKKERKKRTRIRNEKQHHQAMTK